MQLNLRISSLLITGLLWNAGHIHAAGPDTSDFPLLRIAEKKLCITAPVLILGETDEQRISATNELFQGLESILQLPGSFHYPFDSLIRTSVSVVQPSDRSFRLYTFNCILSDGDYLNYGFLQVPDGKEIKLYPLMDTIVRRAKNVSDEILGTGEWLGALYYGVIPVKKKRDRYYILLGYDGMDIHSNVKLMDVLWFDQGEPVFGKEIFLDGAYDKTPSCRSIFEFHNDSRMVLRYEEKQNLIVLDKLAPAFPEAVNDFFYYIPSGDYDCYYFKKGMWTRDVLDQMQFGQGKKPKKPRILPSPERDPLNPDQSN